MTNRTAMSPLLVALAALLIGSPAPLAAASRVDDRTAHAMVGAAFPQREALAAPAPTAKTPPTRVGGKKPAPRPRRTRRYPVTWSSPLTGNALAADLDALVPGPSSGHWGALVVSLTRGDTLWHLHAGQSLMPASTMKLFTSALALDKFGPAYQFRTEVLRDGALGPDGTLTGNLVLRGDGDPAIAPRLLGGSPDDPMMRLARDVAAAGIKRVTGDIVADGSAFEDRRIPEGWKKRYLRAAYAARVSALSLNENLAWVVVHAGKKSAEVWTEPASAGLPVVNEVSLVAGRGARVRVGRNATGALVVRGRIGAQASERRLSFVVDDPATFTAGAFKSSLEAIGVKVGGLLRSAAAPPTAARVASLSSPPLAQLVSAMNGESINLYAELLFRNAARGPLRLGIGSADAANVELMQFLRQKVGVDSGAVSAKDGSGLSTMDRVTPRSLVKVLAYGNASTWSSAFHQSLPVAGESETLRRRMRHTPAQGNLHAKTGTTNDVSSLAGYVTAKNGELLAFAMLYNGTDRWRARARMDRVGATLAAFARQ